jgi:hypothetical protein
MPLTGPQSGQLRDALLSAFKADDLVQMMLFDMNVHLFQVIPEGSLATVAFNLVNWCDAQGRVGELLSAMAARRPQNKAILQTVVNLQTALGLRPSAVGGVAAQPPAAATVPPPTPANPAALLGRLRDLLLGLYPDLDEFVILFEDTLSERFLSVAGNGRPRMQMHGLLQWANANRSFRLCPLLAAVAAQHGNSAELADLRRQFCPG